MGADTAIAWTDHTFNPWWGCERVSPGCQHCYAEAFAKRTGNDVWGKTADRRYFGDRHWADPIKWNRAADAAGRPALVFCASMADVFEDRHEHVPHRERLFDLIEATPNLIWQLLTKRPENVRDMVPGPWLWTRFLGLSLYHAADGTERWEHDLYTWGPALGIGWVIVGGESGPGHRPLELDAARLIVTQCTAAEVPVFFKQIGGRTPTAGGDQLDGETFKQFPASAMRGPS